MERLAKRAVAAAAGVLAAVLILLVVLYASVQGGASAAPSNLGPSRHGVHAPPSGTVPQVPKTPNPPGASLGCDHGQHKDQGKCVGHFHHGVTEGNLYLRGGI